MLAAPLTYWILDGNWGVYIAIHAGLVGGCAIGYFTEYYTSDTYKPTQELRRLLKLVSLTVVHLGGISLGLKSTMASILIVAVAVLVSFFAAGGAVEFNLGLYGVVVITLLLVCCPLWVSHWQQMPMVLLLIMPAVLLK